MVQEVIPVRSRDKKERKYTGTQKLPVIIVVLFSSDYILLHILFLIGVIPWTKPNKKRGRLFYSLIVMLYCSKEFPNSLV